MTIKLTQDHGGYKKDDVVSIDYDTETKWKAAGVAVSSSDTPTVYGPGSSSSSASDRTYLDAAGNAIPKGEGVSRDVLARNLARPDLETLAKSGAYTDNGKPYMAPATPTTYTDNGSSFFTVRAFEDADAEIRARNAREQELAEAEAKHRAARERNAKDYPEKGKTVVVKNIETGKEVVMTRVQFMSTYRAEHLPNELKAFVESAEKGTGQFSPGPVVGGVQGRDPVRSDADVKSQDGRVIPASDVGRRDSAGNLIR